MPSQPRVVLFQGDSITDAGRVRGNQNPNDPAAMGRGYAFLAMCRLLAARPQADMLVYNRGISGNRVPDLEARWQRDCVDLKPDLVSILIGINDLWHRLGGSSHGTPKSYETEFGALLTRTRTALPEARLVLCEPFVLETGVVDESWSSEFDERRAIAESLAQRHAATWVPFHATFRSAVARDTDPAYWADDGVHPTPAGHQLMADVWYERVFTPPVHAV
ncbi:MAG TPA: SGNH/GDSL hydrolase family protein [Polyangiaceae bacterium]